MTDQDSFRIRDRTSLIKGEARNHAGLAFTLLENGSIFSMTHGDVLINQVLGNPMDGALGNVYIRQHQPQGISFTTVRGPASNSQFHFDGETAAWTGTWDGLQYHCMLQLAASTPMWFWTLQISNTGAEPQTVDVVLTQDLGLGAPAAVRTNELYTSQYIDHAAYRTGEYGFVVFSRQNQQQGENYPWILHGCFEGATGYLTDGFQFFGLNYKETNVPAALTAPRFPNSVYQYEFAMPGLQTAPMQIPGGGSVDVTFFSVFAADHPGSTNEKDLEKIDAAQGEFERLLEKAARSIDSPPLTQTSNMFASAPLFASEALTSEDLDRYFSRERRNVEERDGTLLSFFYGPDFHVVTKAKELQTERPHGTILRSGHTLFPDEDALSVTAWMYGVFGSHIAIGNTNFNKLLTISRNPLNVLKSSGQRIFVKTPEGYVLLGVPSAFEMGLNSARWIYKGKDRTIIVTLYISMQDPACFLEIEVEGQNDLEFLISANVVLGDVEFESSGSVRIDEKARRVEMVPDSRELMAQRYPESRFFIVSPDKDKIERVGGDGLLFGDGIDRDNAYVLVQTKPVKNVTLAITGNVLNGRRAEELAARYSRQIDGYGDTLRESEAFWRRLRQNAAMRIETGAAEVEKLNDIIPWYEHNATIHFTAPYGLEQYSGAAWGTRDVCQGPTEFLLATRNVDTLKRTLETVYAHQILQTGDWPQWFMFDRYRDIYAPDSHGDIVIWPLKALCDYVEATNNLSVLDVEVGFTDDETRGASQCTSSLFDHTVLQIERMEKACISGTALIGYGHGDWEDTLQPADPSVRQRWVSPWTVELMYQTLRRYVQVCERAGKEDMAQRLSSLCRRIREDFNRYLVKDGVVAGLVEFGPEGITYLLHPDDDRTGVHYRLLPMTRGMLSEMLTPEQAQDHLALINQHLTFPDGVHLMNRPLAYHGGVERWFKRAETAANFGREIGLQYVHAHIRYVEAMAKIGRPEEALQGLMKIIPINIADVVPSGMLRQSNTYFSSSDAAFSDRYQAFEHFDRIKQGTIGIKGGWRVYSSGPGMVIAELICSLLGLRECYSDILLDPVLPGSLDGLTFNFEYELRHVIYRYHITGDGFSPTRVLVNGQNLSEDRYAPNPYRRGGMLIPKSKFLQTLTPGENFVDIYV